MKKRYKVIANIGYKNEEIKYFDKLTKNRINELVNYYSYVVLYYDKYMECYMTFNAKVNEYQKTLFNANVGEYCERVW